MLNSVDSNEVRTEPKISIPIGEQPAGSPNVLRVLREIHPDLKTLPVGPISHLIPPEEDWRFHRAVNADARLQRVPDYKQDRLDQVRELPATIVDIKCRFLTRDERLLMTADWLYCSDMQEAAFELGIDCQRPDRTRLKTLEDELDYLIGLNQQVRRHLEQPIKAESPVPADLSSETKTIAATVPEYVEKNLDQQIDKTTGKRIAVRTQPGAVTAPTTPSQEPQQVDSQPLLVATTANHARSECKAPAESTSIPKPADGKELDQTSSTANAPPHTLMNDTQLGILKALDGKAMKLKELANAVTGGEPSRLYRAGLKTTLWALGRVNHLPGIGYYRPDKPPLDRVLSALPSAKVGAKK